MSPATWRSLRWLVALAVCALIVVLTIPLAFDAVMRSVEFGEGGAEAEEEEEEEAVEEGDGGAVPSGPVADGSTTAVADFAVRDGIVRQAADPELSMAEDGDAIVIAFPLIDGDPDCVEAAHLHLELLESEPADLAVYASDIANPGGRENGDEVGDPRRDDEAWWITVSDGNPGRLLWDITDLYKAWALAELAPAGSPFTIVVAPPEEAAALLVASTERQARQAPTLTWQGMPDCG